MNILLANKFFHLNGGSETVFFQERQFLLEKGHNVLDFSMLDKRNSFSPCADFFVPNVDYQEHGGLTAAIRQGVSFVHSPVAVENISRLLEKEKAEIAHLHNIYHQLTPAIIPVLKKNGAKVLLTLHDYKLVCPGYLALRNRKICDACQGKYFWKPLTTNCQNSRMRGLLLAAESFWHLWKGSYDSVDLFLAPSRFVADIVSLRIERDKIRVLHNGIDPDQYPPNYDDQGYLIYFGRVAAEKGITTLLRAHRLSGCELPIKIVGSGPLVEELNKKYPDVQFLGYRRGQELKDLVANAAFVVVPSEWYENCSMAVLEAMALGKPVVASRIGGLPEQVEDGKTGFLFSAGDVEALAEKITLLSTNKKLRTVMGRAARDKLVREYSLKDHNRLLLNIYRELLERR